MRLKCMARLQNLTNLFKKGGRRDVFTVNKIDSYLKKKHNHTQSFYTLWFLHILLEFEMGRNELTAPVIRQKG